MEVACEEELKTIPLTQIRENPFQPRRDFAPEELEELAASIEKVGIIHPPTVRHRGEGVYELISGERRFRASALAGLKQIPVLVKASTSRFSAQAALIENVQRVDLNPIEVAYALKKLMESFSLSQDEVSSRIGKKRSTVANYLRLLSLPQTIQSAVAGGSISMGHAKAILSVDGERQFRLFDLIRKKGLTVREAEERGKSLRGEWKKPALQEAERDLFLEDAARRLQGILATRVAIQGTPRKGKLVLDYYSLGDLNRLLEKLGIEEE